MYPPSIVFAVLVRPPGCPSKIILLEPRYQALCLDSAAQAVEVILVLGFGIVLLKRRAYTRSGAMQQNALI